MKPWFEKGLRFQCTGCGKCCTGEPGYVWIDEEEIASMAKHLQLTPAEFKRRYTRFAYGRYALTETKRDHSCIFLKERKCAIYEYRPKQCRKYPWWPQNVRTRAAWEEEKKRCEGIDHNDAPLISCESIQKVLDE